MLVFTMKQITLRLPFAWLTVRLEAPSAARYRSVFPVRHPPIETSVPALRLQLNDRLFRDIGLDQSRSD